jgi:hypothetical protein
MVEPGRSCGVLRVAAVRHRLSAIISAALVAGAVWLVSPGTARACSVCRCGDPAFVALGLDIFNPGRFNIAFDWDRYEKEEGAGEDEEQQVEDRYTLTASYAVSDRVTFVGRLPWSVRNLVEGGDGGDEEQVSTSGMSDPEFFVHVRLWSAPITSGIGSKAWIGARVGVKSAWGENDVTEDGERVDEHAQPGTGAADWIVGLAGVRVLDSRSTLFGSAQYRQTGTNPYGYRYGSATLASVGYERSFGRVLDGVLGFDFRDAGMDQVDDSGDRDPNTGGSLLYLTPALLLRVSNTLVGRVSAQIPIAKSLNGVQIEHPVFNAGITWTF